MSVDAIADRAFEQGQGISAGAELGAAVICAPGRRIKLHPDDYYAYGAGAAGSMSGGFPRRRRRIMGR